MKIVFVSSAFNHYQKSYSDELYKLCDEYYFVEVSEQDEERKKLGWLELKTPYLLKYYEEPDKCQKLIDDADVVIYAACIIPRKLLNNRKKEKKLSLCYTERPLKKGDSFKYFLPRMIKWKHELGSTKNEYLLCNGAYVAKDLERMGLFKNRAYKFGYFIEDRYKDVDELIKNKIPQSLLWVGRFIDWKHPEYALKAAKRLKNEKNDFHLDMIGNGPLIDDVRNYVRENNLQDCVDVLGPKSPDEVMNYMEKSEIYLFTSDRNEGWGVVLNESMQSGCTVITNQAIGSVPYLIRNNENGIIYEPDNFDDFYNKLKILLSEKDTINKLGKNAYTTITNEWSAKTVAERSIEMIKSMLDGKVFDKYKEGPLSKC